MKRKINFIFLIILITISIVATIHALVAYNAKPEYHSDIVSYFIAIIYVVFLILIGSGVFLQNIISSFLKVKKHKTEKTVIEESTIEDDANNHAVTEALDMKNIETRHDSCKNLFVINCTYFACVAVLLISAIIFLSIFRSTIYFEGLVFSYIVSTIAIEIAAIIPNLIFGTQKLNNDSEPKATTKLFAKLNKNWSIRTKINFCYVIGVIILFIALTVHICADCFIVYQKNFSSQLVITYATYIIAICLIGISALVINILQSRNDTVSLLRCNMQI